MKKVLFIGSTNYNFTREETNFHLKKKFEGLSQGIKPYILAKGKPFQKKIWGAEFYLLKPGFLFWLSVFFVAPYLCSKKKIDTIVCQSPLIEGFIGSVLKKVLRKELIVEVHGDWVEAPFLYKKRWPKPLWQSFLRLLGRISLKNADKIRAISSFTKEKALKIAPGKPCFVFPTFTDLNIFLEEKETHFERFILFVGYLHKVKGIQYLIEAFNKIKDEFPDFKLVIVGEGPERKNLKLKTEPCDSRARWKKRTKFSSPVKSLKLENKVEFKGKLSLEETKNIMKNCYCLVLPSLSEGLGRVLMEAEALGKPVIGSNVGGIPDLIKDGKNGFLFEPKNSDNLAQKLRTLLKDKNLAMEMGKKGREFVQNKFSNENYITNYLQMIEK